MDTQLLPPAITCGKARLPEALKAEVLKLNGARPWAFSGALLRTWAVVIGAIVLAQWLGTWWASALAVFIVATRQNLLGLLVHEQAHLLGYRGRFGDLAVNLLAAYPLLVLTVEGYAQVHLAHHRDYFKPSDPDFQRKHGEDWSMPMTRGHLARLLLSDVMGINTLKLVRGKRVAAENPAFARRHRVPAWVRPVYFAAWAGVLTWAGWWGPFLLYWVLPIVTITQVLVRWGALCEHKYNLADATVEDSTPLIVLRWWERLLLPNLNFAMHPYHHYFPGVSFSKLPEIHRLYQQAGLVDERHLFHGYGPYLRYLTSARPAPEAAVPNA